MTDFPVLRIRANDPVTVKEIKLGDVDLIPLWLTDVRISMAVDELTTATLTFHVTPDIELPADVEAIIVNPVDDEEGVLRAQRQAVLDLCEPEIDRGSSYSSFAKRIKAALVETFGWKQPPPPKGAQDSFNPPPPIPVDTPMSADNPPADFEG